VVETPYHIPRKLWRVHFAGILNVFKHSLLVGFWTLSIVRNSKYKKTQRFSNWIFPSSGEGGGVGGEGTPTLLGLLERANLNTLALQNPSNSECYTLSPESFRLFSTIYGSCLFKLRLQCACAYFQISGWLMSY
jgi:hypothetical protein